MDVQAETIDDPSDPRIADYVGLRDPDLRARVESEAGIFIAEGTNVLRRLLASPHHTRSVLVTPTQHARLREELDGITAPVFVAERRVLEAVTGFDLHRGVVASADRPPPAALHRTLAGSTTVLVLEGLNDQENLGAIARTARALGVDALLLDPRCADPFYRRVIRVSMGEILFLPVVRLEPWPGQIEAIRAAGFTIAALTPAPRATSLYEWGPPAKVALLLGAEGPGLSPAALAAADVLVRIPMHVDVDSLNVGHAAAVALGFVSAARA